MRARTAEQIAAARSHLEAENARCPGVLCRMPASAIPEAYRPGAPLELVEVWRSSAFLVQVIRGEFPGVVRATVNRTMIDAAGRWLEGISWDDLQRVKREIGRGDLEAFEVFPRDGDVVNVANLRHLWILEDGRRLPAAWRRGER